MNLQGLSTSEAKKRQLENGHNVLPEKKPPSSFYIFLKQLKNPLIYVLLIAFVITLIINHTTDALIILIAVGINTILGFVQERKASNALSALKNYVKSKVTVFRDGKRESIDLSDIVPGDTVILNQGVKVPADGKLTFSNRLFVNESSLTGESVPISKTQGESVFMGSIIVSGQAYMVVEAIGAKTKIGTIATQIQETKEDTPLQKQLKHFSKQLLVVIAVLISLVFVVGLFYRFSIAELFTTSVALAVSSIPEGLIVSLTVVLAIGMQKILRRRGLVRLLSAAETLGGVTVICVDKTGTLTEGVMKVVGSVGEERELAEQVLLANDLDDPIVISAFEWGRTIIKDFVSEHPRIDSIPFSSKDRYFASLHKWSSKNTRLYVNGAPEMILNWTNESPASKKEILKQIDNLTREGKRLIGFARKDMDADKKDISPEDTKNGFGWVGILAFSDAIRPGVKGALEEAKGAGIRTIVITGDYAKTAEYILSELGIHLTDDQIMTGPELQNITPEDLALKVKKIKLFARTSPDQKLMIVKALKKQGEIVAMMGDGVNDAPALHRADIGIAVGDATDVAKESADLILLDSNFATIVSAIEEGRAMFENIRKIILYLMSDSFTEIFVVLGGIILGLPLPLTAVQILWINLVSDGFPALTLSIDPLRPGIMKEKPRVIGEKLVSRWMIVLIGVVSSVAGLMALTSFYITYKATNDLILARSVAFLTIGLNSLVYVFSVRTLMVPFWRNHLFANKLLVLAVLAGLCLQTLPFISVSFRNFFGVSVLSLNSWLIAGALSIFLFFVIETFKAAYRLKFKDLESFATD